MKTMTCRQFGGEPPDSLRTVAPSGWRGQQALRTLEWVRRRENLVEDLGLLMRRHRADAR